MADKSKTRKRPEGASPAGEALARYYDLDLESDPQDLDMYLAFADASGSTVLELMAGTGRVAVPLALAGFSVTAVDNDPAMLARAATRWQAVADRARKRGALDLVEADVTTLAVAKRFDLVIVALNSLLLLDGRAAQARAMKVVAQHLKPKGRAVIDVWLPHPEDLALYDGRLVLDWIRDDRESAKSVSKTTAARYDSGARIAHITSFFDAWRDGEPPARTSRQDTISFLNADELERFATDAGLVVETVAGDYEMGQFGTDSERVVMVCSRQSR